VKSAVASNVHGCPLDRRTVLAGLATLALAPVGAAQAAVRPAGFVAVGDWGREGSEPQRRVAEAMAAAADEIDNRFVVSVGDNFYPAGVRSVTDPQWVTSFEDVYTAASLQTPWYVALGNHDYRGSARAQVRYSHGHPRWRMPSRYFKVSGADLGMPQLEIFVLDTTPMVGSPRQEAMQLLYGHFDTRHHSRGQLAWLKRELGRSTAPWKVVVGHHPIYSGAHGETPELVEQVRPILEAHGVQAYVNGHDHDLQHIRRGGVDYVCSGSGSDARPVSAVEGTQFCAARPGFAMFTFDADRLRLEFRDLTGQSLYQAAIPGPRLI
jgi:acid phosphatase